MNKKFRIIFAGTSTFSAQHLKHLLQNQYNIIGIFTKADCPKKTRTPLYPNIIKQISQQNNIPIFQPLSSKDFLTWKNTIKNLLADIMIVVSYGIIIPKKILNIPHLGCINIHASLLPKWRGAAPIQRAILAGDKKSGVTIIQMDAGLDTGNILYQQTCKIHPQDTSATLEKKLTLIGKNILIKTLNNLAHNNITPKPQNQNTATYAKKIQKQETKIKWFLSAKEINKQIRAFNPWPGSYFITHGKRIKIWQAETCQKTSSKTPGTILKIDNTGIHIATGQKTLIIKTLQIENKPTTTFQNISNTPKHTLLYPGNILE
ncbi:MAG: 10-formyltetrahydrofolate:L-methionyl-tRNA(fMet) N-formyltransferase [Candidatus Westeberhardia cardiocondylae]|nr:10-formyltetrahydrofolate:L-methionyl-tRNA(fMet) N-formyltransferase [Candidatus Westeberhardia cardiocondylae]